MRLLFVKNYGGKIVGGCSKDVKFSFDPVEFLVPAGTLDRDV
jgi:hypothetical protein